MRDNLERVAVAVLTLIVVAGAARAEEAITAVASVDSITVDGKPGDWKDVPVLAEEGRPWTAAVAANATDIYVLLRFSDLELADAVLRYGTLLWVNNDATHEARFGLRYRGTKALDRGLKQLQKAGAPAETLASNAAAPGSRTRTIDVVRPPFGTLEVLRNAVINEIINDGAQPTGLAAVSRLVDKEFIYEFRIPLAELAAAGEAGEALAPEKIAVGFQLTGLTPAEREEVRARRRGRRGQASPWGNLPTAPPPVDGQAPAAEPATPSNATAGDAAMSDDSSDRRSSRRGRRSRSAGGEAADGAAGGEDATSRRRGRWGTVWMDFSLAGAAEPAAPSES